MTKLDQIREKVIAAVPEIATHRTPCLCKDHGHCPFADHNRVGRPIQLADVLRAIYEVWNKVGRAAWQDIFTELLCSRHCWNLTASLDDQPQEVIDFLHNILV